MKRITLGVLAVMTGGCAEKDADGLPPMTFSDADDSCADYRAAYPSGPYGFTVGSVMEDPPGMVDSSGAAQSLVDVFADRTKMALVIANAFDT